MDLDAQIDHAVGEMDWEEVISTLHSATEVLFGDIINPSPASPSEPPPPPPPPPPSTLPWPSFNFHPLSECQSKRYGQCFHSLHPCEGANPLMAVPGLNWSGQANPIVYRNPNFMQSCPCHGPPNEQHLPYIQSAGNYDPKEQAGFYPSPLSYPYYSVPVWSPPRVMNQELPSARYWRRGEKQDDGKPHIKKPLNAFMLFLKEMRTKKVAEHDFENLRTFNTSMGKMWQALSESEKDKYYKQSDIERHLHSQQHPSWTCNKNYGKRRSTKTRTGSRRSASKPQEVPAQANKPCVIPVQTAAVMEAYTSHTVAMMAPHTQTFLSEQPHTRTAVTLPVCNSCQGIQVPHSYWLDSSKELPSTF